MNISKSSNPAFGSKIFNSAKSFSSSGYMTVQGTVNKSIVMLLIILLAASYTWKFMGEGNMAALQTYMLIGGIGGFITALVTVFKIQWSPYTAPVYALLEGLFLGGISALFNARFEGIIVNAVTLTFGTFFALLFAYKTGMIRVTNKFRTGIMAATGGIALAYFFSFILGFFGINIGFIHGNGTMAIVFSLVVVVVAALNLVLDFDFIEKGAASGAPKFMEWYGAFGLMVTLIWLYIEFLRLLAKLSSRE